MEGADGKQLNQWLCTQKINHGFRRSCRKLIFAASVVILKDLVGWKLGPFLISTLCCRVRCCTGLSQRRRGLGSPSLLGPPITLCKRKGSPSSACPQRPAASAYRWPFGPVVTNVKGVCVHAVELRLSHLYRDASGNLWGPGQGGHLGELSLHICSVPQ